ncbi:MAG: respiratory nitrate reductase subunit gamma [Chlamydiota bacterium]|nr:respiratory nitrate reductase subunit gamma [Chlamydiota bacterium]
MSALNNFLFIALPYVAMAVFLAGSIYRYRASPFKISSLSSQFLEGEKLFWASVPFHLGLMMVLLLHLWAVLFPNTLLSWNSIPVRLVFLEITGFMFALGFLFGLIFLIFRRVSNARVWVVTTWMDMVIELLLLCQVILGCLIALGYRWGSAWFASDLSPYLWSLMKLDPRIDAVVSMPGIVQAHVVGFFLIVLIFPFTRLMHFLVLPFHYLLRPYQQVIWNWDRKSINNPDAPWTQQKPKNN